MQEGRTTNAVSPLSSERRTPRRMASCLQSLSKRQPICSDHFDLSDYLGLDSSVLLSYVKPSTNLESECSNMMHNRICFNFNWLSACNPSNGSEMPTAWNAQQPSTFLTVHGNLNLHSWPPAIQVLRSLLLLRRTLGELKMEVSTLKLAYSDRKSVV